MEIHTGDFPGLSQVALGEQVAKSHTQGTGIASTPGRLCGVFDGSQAIRCGDNHQYNWKCTIISGYHQISMVDIHRVIYEKKTISRGTIQ